MKIDSVETLLQDELQDIYDAEKQLTKALPKMAKAVSSDELRQAITEHLEVTKGQVSRIEEVFDALGIPAKSKSCAAMKGLIEEGKECMESGAEDPYLDESIIGAARRVEHYEIAAYETAIMLAEKLDNEKAVELLNQTLEEEKEADEKLTEIAESLLEGAAGGEEEDADGGDAEGAEEVSQPTRRRRSA